MDPVSDSSPKTSRKRKLDPEIEVDLTAPEPPSKKALRKAKKKPGAVSTEDSKRTTPEPKAKESGSEQSKKRTTFEIWIGNLPFTATQDDLRKFFTTQGTFTPDEITRLHLPSSGEKNNGRQVLNKGFAYVGFSTSEAVQRAVALSEKLLSGRAVLIKDANDYSGRPEKSDAVEKPSNKTPSRKIFVGNLAFDITKEMLEEHYQPCGSISHVHIATFQDSGKCKGYGWVEFEELDSAVAAIRGFVKVPEDEEADASASDGQPKKRKEKKVWVNRLLGRTLRMEFAEDSTTRYNKRFGKEGSKREDGSKDKRQNDEAAPIEEVSTERSSSRKTEARTRPKTKAKGSSTGRYSEETVQRLSGTIVESQGKKTTFD
ncbi:conserved hypothetical protein [Uncinocarpus reesii 1704]|uniref:RRM domain-containing protein n=1 Tax=Uncinocarpus reesii (strain UAMH 1704) TaxID=336963 RepID=C4JWJ0_UNCRE|nr:uncharacterized protein UREG_06932 [Uncinocarpus reesii 1704]EEP82067.1 conserved hypothetical protein [Uncinocarpus reesii 1704]